MFSQYCAEAYTIEAVEVESEATGAVKTYPNLEPVPFVANVAYVNSAIGIDVTPEQMTAFLKKMSMESTLDEKKENITVLVPPTRSDVLHAWSETGQACNRARMCASAPHGSNDALALHLFICLLRLVQ